MLFHNLMCSVCSKV